MSKCCVTYLLTIYDHCLASDLPQLNNRLTHYIEIVGHLMSSNRLRLNPSKTEFIWLGSTHHLARCTFVPITIGGEIIQPSQTVRDLGAYTDSSIGFAEHVTRLVKTCYFHIRQLRSIRRSLTIESSHALVRALVLTRLDYCNGLLGGAPKCLLSPLSGVLRAAARLILLLPRTSSVSDRIRTELHWLDIRCRVTFKLCVLAYRCLHGSAPAYLVRYFTPVSAIAGHSHLRRRRVCCLYREQIPRQLALEHSRSHPRRLGTASRSIFVIPVIAFKHLDGSLKLMCSTCHPFSYFVQMNIYWLISILCSAVHGIFSC